MAREIKTTPDIEGKDAINFYRSLEENRHKTVSDTVLQRIEQSVQFFKSNSIKMHRI